MADIENNTVIGVVDKRVGRGLVTASPLGTPANYSSIYALRTRLTAISGTTYSAAELNKMTRNDLIYALRVNDDSAGV